MQANYAMQSTPPNALINDLLNPKVVERDLGLSKHAIEILGSQTEYKCYSRLHANAWSQLMNLAVDFGVSNDCINGLLKPVNGEIEISNFCDTLIKEISIEMEKFKKDLLALWSMTDVQQKKIDDFGGNLTITNDYEELNNVPSLVIYASDIYVMDVFGDKLNKTQKNSMFSILQFLSNHCYCIVTTELIESEYIIEQIREHIDEDATKELLQADVDSWDESIAMEFFTKRICNESMSDFELEFGFDDPSEIEWLDFAKLIAELEKTYTVKIDVEDSLNNLQSKYRKNSKQAKKVETLKRLVDKVNVGQRMQGINTNVEGRYDYMSFRPFYSRLASSELLDNVYSHVMETGVNTFMAFDSESKSELLNILKNIYLSGFIAVAMSELFD